MSLLYLILRNNECEVPGNFEIVDFSIKHNELLRRSERLTDSIRTSIFVGRVDLIFMAST